MTSSLPELEALLRDRPDDPLAWLVYADFLQEQGDPRGKLILLERRLADTSLSIDERHEAGQEAHWLAADHRKDWLAGWSARVEATLTWRYGFVTAAVFPQEDGLVGLESLLALPTARFLTRVELSWLQPDQIPALLRVLERGVVRELRLVAQAEAPLGEEGAAALVQGESVRHLRSLSLCAQRLGSAGLRALADATTLVGLGELELERDPPGPDGLAGLGDSVTLASLHTLRLPSDELDDLCVQRLVAGRGLPGLSSLDLRGNQISDVGVRALERSARFPALTSLDLSNNLLGEGTLSLAETPGLSALDLSGNPLAEDTFEALTRSTLYGRGALRLWGAYDYD